MAVPGAPKRGTEFRLQPVALADTFPSAVRVSDILDLPGFAGSRVLTGERGLDARIEHVNVIQIPTDRFVKRDELVLTAASTFRRYEGDVPALIGALMSKGISALGVRGRIERLLGSAIPIADREDLPLIELSTRTHLSELQTQVLETIVRARTRQLKQAESIRDQLADHVLRGGGLEAVVEGVANVVQGDVVLFGRAGELLGASVGADTEKATRVADACLEMNDSGPGRTDGGWIAWPVLAAGRRIGCLIARTSGEYDATHHAALQHGATDAALQILHRDEALEAHARLKAGFVRDLLIGSASPVSALRRARAIGWDPEGSFRALLVGLTERDERGALMRALRQAAPRALVTERSGACLAITPTVHHDAPRDMVAERDEPARLADWAISSFPGTHVGMSAIHSGLEELPAAVEEAREALRTSRIFDRRTRIRRYDELGALLFLSHVPVEELTTFERAVLRPLDDIDPPHRSSLLETLRIVIESDLNVAETARRGGWHYNTVRNRVARLSDLFGPLTDAGTILDAVRLALVIRQDLGTAPPAGDTPAGRTERARRPRAASTS